MPDQNKDQLGHELKIKEFLFDASRLLASSLDFETTLSSAAKISVPRICDWCAIDLIEENGSVKRLEVANIDPEKVRLAYDLERLYPTDFSLAHGLGQVLRTGKSELYSEITEEMLIQYSRDPKYLELIRKIGFSSIMIVALKSTDNILGAITFIAAESKEHYTVKDLQIVEQFADQASIAIDNSRKFSEADYQSILLKSVSDAVISTDAHFKIKSWNRAAEFMYGWKEEEVKGKDISEILQTEYLGSVKLYGQQTELIKGSDWKDEVIQTKKNLDKVYVLSSVSVLEDRNEQVVGIVEVNRDITERKESERLLLHSEKRFRTLIEKSANGILLLDPTGTVITMGSPILGYSQDEWIGKNIFTILHPEDISLVSALMKKITETAEKVQSQTLNFECRVKHQTGHWHWIECVATNLLDDSSIRAIVVNYRDITEQKQTNDLIKYQANHDPLTGLPNRKALEENLFIAISDARASKKKLGILFLDLDRFKNINDSLGHIKGDALLREIANRIQTTLNEQEIISRFAGDEFVIMLPEIESSSVALEAAQRILNSFSEPFSFGQHTMHISTSIGVSVYPEHGHDSGVLLKNADTALYTAKESGRNRYQIYDQEMEALTERKFAIEMELRKAIKEKQFVLFYQPIFDLRTNKLVAVEALVRWNHPTLGLLLPKQFISVTEEIGLMFQLGEWILNEACSQNKKWQQRGYPNFKMAVNISAKQFSETSLVQLVKRTLERTALEPTCLELEINEGIAMDDLNLTAIKLNQLKDMGVEITIDDFGTGYSSLAYLKRFPIHNLKIDQSFISGCDGNEQDANIVKAIILMAEGLKINVIAEGAERLSQLDYLKSLGCYRIQGFILGRPVSADEIEKLFLENKLETISFQF